MKKIFLPSLFALGFMAGAPGAALAQSVEFVPPMTTESGETVKMQDDALNYFATSAEKHKEIEAQRAAMPEGHVPASELEYLPEELEIGGKARLKIQGGRILSNTEGGAQHYNYCEDYAARGEAIPDGCIQKNGAEPTASPATATPPAMPNQQPQTLDAQLEAKGETAPEQAPPVNTNNTMPPNQTGAGVNVGNTAVIDKTRGAKTNIISNTDTGVKLDY